MDLYYRVHKSKILDACVAYRQAVEAYYRELAVFCSTYGFTSYSSGVSGEAVAFPLRLPLPPGWEANKKKSYMYPKDRSILPKYPTDSEVRSLVKPVDLIRFSQKFKSGSISNLLRSYAPFSNMKVLWIEDKYYLVVANPEPKKEELLAEDPETSFQDSTWFSPKGLKEISKEDFNLELAKFRVRETKNKSNREKVA